MTCAYDTVDNIVSENDNDIGTMYALTALAKEKKDMGRTWGRFIHPKKHGESR